MQCSPHFSQIIILAAIEVPHVFPVVVLVLFVIAPCELRIAAQPLVESSRVSTLENTHDDPNDS